LAIDSDLALNQVTPQLLAALARMEPFGQQNPEPVFSSCGVNLLAPPRIIKEKHIKLRVNQKRAETKNSFSYEAVGWRMAERLQSEGLQPGEQLDLAFKITMNQHPEFGGLELSLEDFRKTAIA
jgi:single-stranded-DNA-specific exonuclease